MDSSDSSDALIEKNILYNGSKFIPFTDGTKVTYKIQNFPNVHHSKHSQIPIDSQVKFHYQTRTCRDNDVQCLLDDSKKTNRPMELIIGKKFKLEVWEAILKNMSLNEVAKFRVHKSV